MADLPEFANVKWREGNVPVSDQFDDPYFSLTDGLAETQHVFLHGNDLPNRLCDGFHISEIGFGTGLNLLAAWALWDDAGISGQLKYTSFEAYPLNRQDLEKAHQRWPELHRYSQAVLDAYQDGNLELDTAQIQARIILGDANKTLANWQGIADCWFLDGFSPSKNPALWQAQLMHDIAAHTKPNGTFATFTAAGHVRQALTNAGFAVERVTGYGRKRHMTVGHLL